MVGPVPGSQRPEFLQCAVQPPDRVVARLDGHHDRVPAPGQRSSAQGGDQPRSHDAGFPTAAWSDDGEEGPTPAERGTTLPDLVRELEEREIRRALRQSAGNKSRTAELLGLSRFALQRKLDKYGVDADEGAAT